jgi:hypothetical protein
MALAISFMLSDCGSNCCGSLRQISLLKSCLCEKNVELIAVFCPCRSHWSALTTTLSKKSIDFDHEIMENEKK